MIVYVNHLQTSQSQQLLLFGCKREHSQARNICRNGSKVQGKDGNGAASSEGAELLQQVCRHFPLSSSIQGEVRSLSSLGMKSSGRLVAKNCHDKPQLWWENRDFCVSALQLLTSSEAQHPWQSHPAALCSGPAPPPLTAFTMTELLFTTKKMCASNWKSLFGWALSENSEGSARCRSRGSSPAHSPWEQEENETPNVSWKCLAPLCCSLSLNSSCSRSKCKLEASFAT